MSGTAGQPTQIAPYNSNAGAKSTGRPTQTPMGRPTQTPMGTPIIYGNTYLNNDQYARNQAPPLSGFINNSLSTITGVGVGGDSGVSSSDNSVGVSDASAATGVAGIGASDAAAATGNSSSADGVGGDGGGGGAGGK